VADGQVRQRLERALRTALKSRDRVAVSAVRSALAAIDNAGAVPPRPARAFPSAGGPYVAGSAGGPGAGEAERRVLSEAEAADIVRAEIAERQAAAGDYERRERTDQASRLRREAQVLESALGAG
jgi:uncharacterized protein YqeY